MTGAARLVRLTPFTALTKAVPAALARSRMPGTAAAMVRDLALLRNLAGGLWAPGPQCERRRSQYTTK